MAELPPVCPAQAEDTLSPLRVAPEAPAKINKKFQRWTCDT